MAMTSPGFTDLSSSNRIPLNRLETTFCRPNPMPTPNAPEKNRESGQVNADAGEAGEDGDRDQQNFCDLGQQHLYRGGEVWQRRDAPFDQPAHRDGTPQQNGQGDQRPNNGQCGNPQAAEIDGNGIEDGDGRAQ